MAREARVSMRRISDLRDGAVAVMALLRRDLLAGSRATPLRIARAAAMLSAGGAVLVAYASVRLGNGGEVALAAMGGTFSMLTLIAALSAPQAAIQSLRRERDAGMLDLLVVAGLTPSRLALGRILATFINLVSLLLTTLPAFALLAFFGRPTAGELLACVGIIACSWLALAAFSVAVSAWARSNAAAVALAIGGLVGWSLLLFAAAIKGVMLTGTAMLAMILSVPAAGLVERWNVIAYVVLHLGIAWLSWWAAAVGIRRGDSGTRPVSAAFKAPAPAVAGVRKQARPARRPSWLRRLAGQSRPLRGKWPLSWLLQRRAPVARPRTLAFLLLIPPIALSWKGEDGLVTCLWTLTLLTLVVALLVPAMQVSTARERHQWDSLVATSIEGSRAVIDLVRGALVASAMPFASTLLAIFLAGFLQANATGVVRSLAAAIGFLFTWLVVALLGTAAGLIAGGSASAVRLGAWLLLLVGGGPFVTLGCIYLVEDGHLDWYGLLPAVLLVALAAGSMVGTMRVKERNGGRAPLVAVPAAWAFALAPMIAAGDLDKARYFVAGGLGGLVALTWDVAPPHPLASPLMPLLFAPAHVLLAVMLFLALTRRADRWLGRPA